MRRYSYKAIDASGRTARGQLEAHNLRDLERVSSAIPASPDLAQFILDADEAASKTGVDFLSIGTNDLIQYTLAIDRVDDEVNYLYDPMHPAVLQLIRLTIQAGEQAGIPVAMCGEMAGDPRFTRLLLGLGLTDFSMHPASVLEVKEIVVDSNIARLRAAVAEALESGEPQELRERIAALQDL